MKRRVCVFRQHEISQSVAIDRISNSLQWYFRYEKKAKSKNFPGKSGLYIKFAVFVEHPVGFRWLTSTQMISGKYFSIHTNHPRFTRLVAPDSFEFDIAIFFFLSDADKPRTRWDHKNNRKVHRTCRRYVWTNEVKNCRFSFLFLELTFFPFWICVFSSSLSKHEDFYKKLFTIGFEPFMDLLQLPSCHQTIQFHSLVKWRNITVINTK